MSDSTKAAPAAKTSKSTAPKDTVTKSPAKTPKSPRNTDKTPTSSPSKTKPSKEKEASKDTSTNTPKKSKTPRPKSKTSSPAPTAPPPKKSPSPSPSKSPRGPKAGASRDNLRLPRLRSTNSLGPPSAVSIGRSRSAASSPSSSSKRPLGSVTPRFRSANIPIPVPDYPKAERARRRNAESESSALMNGHGVGLSSDQGVFSPGLANSSRRRPEFVIHPEWISEATGMDQLPPLPHPFRTKKLYSDSMASAQAAGSLWPKRCKSAPPPNYRNPITWAE